MSGSTLVSTETLSRDLGGWRIFDCRHDLAEPDLGERQHREGHIPGALFAHLDRDLSGPKTGANGRHPLPERSAFLAWLGKQGLKPTDRVACYDTGNGTMAARLWWMLRWAGHASAAVLDGGFAKWLAEKRPVTRDVAHFNFSKYPERPPKVAAVDVKEVERNLQRMLLLDARAPVRFRGEQEPIDPIAGRIPGAANRYNAENISAQGTFKSAGELRKEFEAILGARKPSEVIHYCGSGVAACHNLLAMEIAGLPGGKLYAGSWSEWSADPKRAIAR